MFRVGCVCRGHGIAGRGVQFLGAWISRCRQHGDREFVSLVDRHSEAADPGILSAGFCVCIHGGDVIAGSPGSSPESSIPGGTDTRSGAASSGTQIIHVKPTDGHGNLLPRYSAGATVEELSVPGMPSITPSPFGGSAYAIDAAVAGSSLNDCWPAAQPHNAVCLFNPDDTTVTPISVAEDLPVIDPVADLSPDVRPWQIQLDDGLVCGARTHGSTTFRETYQCMDPATGSEDEIKSTVSNVDTAASVWTIQQVNAPSLDAIPDRDNPPTRTAQIVTAWFNG